jgi:hypothetical protein
LFECGLSWWRSNLKAAGRRNIIQKRKKKWWKGNKSSNIVSFCLNGVPSGRSKDGSCQRRLGFVIVREEEFLKYTVVTEERETEL